MWGGTIITLNHEATKSLTYILQNKTTANTTFMDATKAEGITPWQGLAGKLEMVAVQNTIIENMKKYGT